MPDRAPRNRTLSCTTEERARLSRDIMRLEGPVHCRDLEGRLVGGDFFEVAGYFPPEFADLLILDPPYNLTKNFNGTRFRQRSGDQYRRWFADLIDRLLPMMKPQGTLYVCSDWTTSALVFPILESKLQVRNRITWEREKGRGAKRNWKNNTEDIWFCTISNEYHFDVDAVKLKRRVIAPYRVGGEPKDWTQDSEGKYRMTHPSNIWTDITVPFWSMPENTDHPAQKPEKLIAKLILASSRQGDFVFDPFVGSGTTAVVAQKLARRWCGVERETDYLCWALKRLAAAHTDPAIQGYDDGVFLERNTNLGERRKKGSGSRQADMLS